MLFYPIRKGDHEAIVRALAAGEGAPPAQGRRAAQARVVAQAGEA
jgi:hypothetical protein